MKVEIPLCFIGYFDLKFFFSFKNKMIIFFIILD